MITLTDSIDLGAYIDLDLLLGLFSIGLLIIIILKIRNHLLNKRVTATSPYLKKIKEINKATDFKPISRTHESKTYRLNSKRSYDNFNSHRGLDEFIRDDLRYYQRLVSDLEHNIETLKEYNKQIKAIPLTSDESITKSNRMSLKSYQKRELKLGSKELKHPTTGYTIKIRWEYTSPAGRNHYSSFKDFYYADIRTVVNQYTVKNSVSSYPIEKTSNTHSRPKPQQQPSQRIYTNDDIEDID